VRTPSLKTLRGGDYAATERGDVSGLHGDVVAGCCRVGGLLSQQQSAQDRGLRQAGHPVWQPGDRDEARVVEQLTF
jgi:hypothetical protein